MTSFSDIINANIRQRRAADAADADRFALTVFDDVQLGTVERCEATNVTTFPDIIDDAGHYFSVYGSLAYALAAARDYITVGGPIMTGAPLLVCAHCGRDIVSDEPYMANGHPYCDGFCYRDALDDDYREAVADAAVDYGFHDHDPF